ncbi:MAG TPA: V-type ATP synthase subunit F [Acidimicrobiales bacterium]|nr:V-type ATP synthase subunit F [Acidimicrobiales bacterium]
MSTIVVLGERHRVEGFALAGATVFVAADADSVRDAWARLPDDVVVVVLTPAAADALADVVHAQALQVVLPT